MRFKYLLIPVALMLIGALVFWQLTAPGELDAQDIAKLGEGSAENGERMFWTGGCSSCHAVPKSEGEDRLKLAGGMELVTPFGTFVAPNISPDMEDGIGGWSKAAFANAMLNGVSPDGYHYYPAFPYSSYRRMSLGDIADLHAFMMTLPAVKGKQPDHQLAFPFNIRRGLGLWKRMFLHDGEVVDLPADSGDAAKLGQYLVEGPGHCGECHTPRNFIGGPDRSRWLAGAVAAEGDGNVPNITSGEGGIGSWSETDIAYFLESGFLPDFDTVGGSMVEVQKNMAKLESSDREAIAAYLKSIPPHANGY